MYSIKKSCGIWMETHLQRHSSCTSNFTNRKLFRTQKKQIKKNKDESDFGHTPNASEMYRRQLTSFMAGSCLLIPLGGALSFCQSHQPGQSARTHHPEPCPQPLFQEALGNHAQIVYFSELYMRKPLIKSAKRLSSFHSHSIFKY